ncbi:unnamed protein product, partial [Tetraodon nigroviridis]
IWMLTGDKLETATCIAKSSHLVSRNQDIHVFRAVSNRGEAHLELNAFRRKHDCALVISGDSLEAVFSSIFYFASVPLYQGFLMVGYAPLSIIKIFTTNDKVDNLHNILVVLVIPYVTSCRILLCRYATIYTMFPVFSLVLDEDVKPDMALLYPELYKDLTKGRSLSFKTFLIWVLISVYQGGILMYGGLVLFESEFVHVVAISFTALILTELLMVALTIRTWHWLMMMAEFFSLACYLASLAFLNEYFDLSFITTWPFLWKVFAVTLVSCFPLYVIKYLKRKFSPPSYSKLSS